MAIDVELDEMKRAVKTDDDARAAAIAATVKAAKGKFVTVKELLAADNVIRKAYGLNQIDAYPVLEMEFSPSTGASVWKRIVGVQVIKKPGQLPVGMVIYEDVESFDPAKRNSEIDPLVDAKIKEDFPGTSFSKQELAPIKKAVRLSIIKKMQLAEGSTEDTQIPEYLDEDGEEAVEEAKPKKKQKGA